MSVKGRVVVIDDEINAAATTCRIFPSSPSADAVT